MARYDHIDTVGVLEQKGAEMRKKTVTVVGLGSIGSSVAEILARMGLSLRIIDRDRVKEEDLAHLSLFGEDHVSKFKAKEAKKILESLNKDIKVRAFHEDITTNNAYLVESDVIIDCTNDMATSLLVDKAAKKAPVVFARAYDTDGYIFLASSVRVRQVSDHLEKLSLEQKTPVLATTTHLVASLAVNKALKVLSDQKVEKNCLHVDGWKFSFDKITLRKNKK